MADRMHDHPPTYRGVRQVLWTTDAETLYEKFGFTRLPNKVAVLARAPDPDHRVTPVESYNPAMSSAEYEGMANDDEIALGSDP